jgi:putative transposase
MGRGKQGSKKRDNKRRLHSWSFAQLYSFVEYKAEARGIRVVKVDPRHTSQTCSFCRFQHRSNRRSQSLFKCRECGYTLNADLNASYNIREKHLSSLADIGTPLLVDTSQRAHRVAPSGVDASPSAQSQGWLTRI